MWLTSVLFYDEYGNLIQKQGNNLQQTGASLADVTTLVYRAQGFVPQVLRSVKTQQTGAAYPVVVRNRFAYDAAGRLLQTWQQHQFKGQWEPEVLLNSNRYESLGELTQKRLHSRDGGAKFLQYEDFAYNLHGQLTRINNSNILTNNYDNDLFGLELTRESSNSTGNVPRYDGGISAVSWATHNEKQTNQPERERSYRFTYDGLGWLTEARYSARNRPWENFTLEAGAYNETMSYDANGNINGLQRYTQDNSTATPVVLDQLYFGYYGTGNQPNWIDDSGGDQTRGFKERFENVEYNYDPNGSVTRDANKAATYVYNTLNKVERQAMGTGSISYTYDAGGTVLKRETVSATGTQTEYYVDGFVYEVSPGFSGLRSVPSPEGRALVTAATDTKLTYEYHLRDHLGNLRVAFRAQASTEDLRLSSEDPSQEEGPYPRFENVTATRSQETSAYRGSYVASVTSAKAGPAVSIPVANGDRLKVRVYCKTPNGVQTYLVAPPTTMLQAVPTVTAALTPNILPITEKGREEPGRPRYTPGIQVSVTGLLSTLVAKPRAKATAAILAGGPGPLGDYNAYLTWALTDSKGTFVRSGNKVVPVYSDSQWRQLDLVLTSADIDLTSDEARTGTLRIQEVNYGSRPVYFDSLTITHPQDRALVSQENHYYPLGMAMSGVAVNTQPAAKISKQQFNDGSELQDELLGADNGVYSTFYRTYDPTIGRFNGVDPLADEYVDWSPYQFALGNPIAANDPTGALTAYNSWADLINDFFAGGAAEGHYTSGDGGGGRYQ